MIKNMTKKILSFFYEDLQWKLISLGLAFVIWLVAMNWHDPLENDSFTRELQIMHLEILARDELVLTNEQDILETAINMGVRSNRSSFATVTDTDFSVYLDMRSVDSALAQAADEPITMMLPVSFNLQPGFERQYLTPSMVEVRLDRRVSQSFALEIERVGQVADGLEIRSQSPANPMIVVTGARELINTIDRVVVEIDLSNLDESVNAPIIVLDSHGVDITSQVITLSQNETTIFIEILAVKTVELRVATEGTMASGFAISGVLEASELTVDIVGTPLQLEDIEYIEVLFDLEGLSESTERTIRLQDFLPPNGVELSHDTPREVTIAANVEPIQQRTLFVPWRDVAGYSPGALFDEINPPSSVRIVVSGAQSVVGAMTASQLRVTYDLRNLPAGVHWISLNVGNLPAGVSLVEAPQQIQMQIFEPAREDPTTSPEPTPTPEPDPDPEPTAEPSPEPPYPEPTPEPTSTPEPSPEPTPSPTPEPTPEPEPNGNNGNGYENDDPPDEPPDDDYYEEED